jgi:hypothetical protein
MANLPILVPPYFWTTQEVLRVIGTMVPLRDRRRSKSCRSERRFIFDGKEKRGKRRGRKGGRKKEKTERKDGRLEMSLGN